MEHSHFEQAEALSNAQLLFDVSPPA